MIIVLGCSISSAWIGLLLLAVVTVSAMDTTGGNNIHNINSNFTLAIGLSFRDIVVPPHPVTGKTEEHTVLLMTCHFPTLETANNIPVSDCCSAMTRAAQAAHEKDGIADTPRLLLGQLTSSTNDVIYNCEQEGSGVTSTANSHSNRFAYYAAAISKQQQLATQTIPQNNNNLYVWNDAQRTGVWLDDVSLGLELPAWVTPFLSSDNEKLHFTTQSRIPADFRSVLSPTGGMHRSLDHTLDIPLEDIRPLLLNMAGTDLLLSLEASFMVMVPSGMFLDAEDAFDEHRWSVAMTTTDDSSVARTVLPLPSATTSNNFTLSLHSHNIMDIEQPAFDSPQHAVMVHLKWTSTVDTDNNNNNNNKHPVVSSLLELAQNKDKKEDSSLVFQFTTKVHLRYPSPVSADAGGTSSLYQPVLLLPPIWVSGRLALVQHQRSAATASTQAVLQLTGSSPWHLFGYEPSLSSSPCDGDTTTTTTTWVASAPQDDFIWVATITVLCSLLGAMMLGYETSTIVHD